MSYSRLVWDSCSKLVTVYCYANLRQLSVFIVDCAQTIVQFIPVFCVSVSSCVVSFFLLFFFFIFCLFVVEREQNCLN